MSHRNPMNPRSQNKSYKGVSRKSASSAKPVRQAGSSVYVKSQAVRDKAARKQMKDEQKEETRKERMREDVLAAQAVHMPLYKKWRKRWVITIVVAIIVIAASFISTLLVDRGLLPEDIFGTARPLTIALLVIGYAGLIFAVYIDFRKIRPIRRAQQERAHSLSKRERRELDKRIAESATAREKTQDAKTDKPARLPWNKKKEDTVQDGGQAPEKD